MGAPAPFRFTVEAAVLIAVGLALAAAELGLVPFVLVMGVTWLLIATGERMLLRPRIALHSARGHSPEPVESPPPVHHRADGRRAMPPPVPERESTPHQEPEPEPEPKRVVAVPEPEPERQPEPEPEPEPELEVEPDEQVVELPQTASRRPDGWNLWDLEQRARQRAGQDPLRDEEWNALFVSLRGFASPDGTLPPQFDQLVHESFGELISRRA